MVADEPPISSDTAQSTTTALGEPPKRRPAIVGGAGGWVGGDK